MRNLYKKAETTIDKHFNGTDVGTPDQWEMNLKKLLFLTYPELAKYRLLYSIKKQEDLNGIGTIAVINKNSYVTFPFIIKNEKAYPLDVVILSNGSIIPYDKNDVMRALITPELGVKAELPVTNQTLKDVVGVPDFLKYRGGTMFGGTTKTAEVIANLNTDATMLYKIARDYIDFSLLNPDNVLDKTASAAVITKLGGGNFSVKIATDDGIEEKTLNSNELYNNGIEPPLSGYKILTSGGNDITYLPEEYNSLIEKTAEITEPATIVTLDSKMKLSSGVVLPNIISIDGVPSHNTKLFVTDDGYSFNTKIAGVPLANLTESDLRLLSPTASVQTKTKLHGVFVLTIGGKLVATEPVTITGYDSTDTLPKISVTTATGKSVVLKLTDAVKTIIPRGNTVLVPATIKFLPTTQKLVSKIPNAAKIKVAAEQLQKTEALTLVYDKNNGRFSLTGTPLRSLPIKSSEFLKEPDVALILAQIGLSKDTISSLISSAKTSGKISFDTTSKIKKDVKSTKNGVASTYSEVKQMSKIASIFGDTVALSTLSGLASPEGELAVNSFKSKLNDVRQDLAKLLLMSRLEILTVDPEKAKILLDFYTKILHNVK